MIRRLALPLVCVLSGGAMGQAVSLPLPIALDASSQDSPPEASALRKWVDDLRQEDPLARELAVRALIDAGEVALPLLDRIRGEAMSAGTRLAVRRIEGGILGLARGDADTARKLVEDALRGGETHLHEAARTLTERGPDFVSFALGLCAKREDSASKALSRRLQTMRCVHDLAFGANRADRAGRALADLGPGWTRDLQSLALDRDLPDAVRSVASERLTFLQDAESVGAAIAIVHGGNATSRELLLPYLCEHVSSKQLPSIAALLNERLEQSPGFAGHLDKLANRLSDDEVASHLNSQRNSTVRLAARLAGIRRSSTLRDAVVGALAMSTDDAPLVASACALALGHVGSRKDVKRLAGLLTHDSRDVRRAAATSLALLPGDDALAWTAACLRDADAVVRATAATALGRSKKTAAVASLIATLDDDEWSVSAQARSSLDAITGRSGSRAQASTTDRDELQRDWRRWWAQQRDSADESDAEGAEDDSPADLAAPLAEDGERILRDIADVLRSQFRPYGALKDEALTTPNRFLEQARRGMLETLDRTEDEEEPDQLLVSLEGSQRDVLRHVVEHGRFRDASDLADAVGSLPFDVPAQDYVLLVYQAADSMVSSLGDRFTRLSMSADASGKVDPDSLPSLFGQGKTNGLMTKRTETGVVVEFVLAHSPANDAGLRVGDKILSVGGELAEGLTDRQLARRLSEETVVSILRDGWTRPVGFTLVPETSDPDELIVSSMLPGNIGYVRLREFELGCAQKLEWAMRELERQGCEGLVFDLRNNPGGTVIDAVSIVDRFVGKGSTITTLWSNSYDEDEEYDEEVYTSTDSETDRDYPVAVLVNKNSASASEMTSGSLQDLDRAIVVGRTSWGKGIGQSGAGVAGFPRNSIFGTTSSSMSLGITTIEYFLPTGRSIQGSGVVPDVPVAVTTLLGERYELMQRARKHPKTAEFIDELIASDEAAARELARFDGWDPSAYEGFDAWSDSLRLELNDELLRRALRQELRSRFAATHPELRYVDVQEDEDVRAAIAALAPELALDLANLPEYEDLSE